MNRKHFPIVLVLPAIFLFCYCSDVLEQTYPDLIIADLSISPVIPTIKDSATLSVTVKNAGQDGCPDSCILALSIAGRSKPELFVIPTLAAGDTCILKRKTLFKTAKSYTAAATADYMNDIVESDEDNNAKSITFIVQTAPLPDLTIDTIRIFPFAPLTTDSFTLFAVVKNSGVCTSATSVGVIKIGDESSPPADTIQPLAPGSMQTLTRTVLVPVAQTMAATVIVDVNNSVIESNELNNLKAISVTVTNPFLPDLVVDSLYISPVNPSTADTITVTAKVKNKGAGIAKGSFLSMKNSGADPQNTRHPLPGLAPGADYLIHRMVYITSAQTCRVIALVDSANTVLETNDTNNARTIQFTVTVPPPPDLVIDTMYIFPETPSVTDSFSIFVTVKNTGLGPADSSVLSLSLDTGTTPFLCGIPALRPGSYHEIEQKTLLTTASVHSATAKADADNSLAETNENNNTKVLQFTVYPPLPDLIIDTLYITPANPKTTDSITITTVVTNTGAGNSDSFRLCIEISGDTIAPRYSVPGLAAGASRSILRKTLLPIAQKYLITATADIDQKVIESNESNNDEYIFIEVTQQVWKQRSVWGRKP